MFSAPPIDGLGIEQNGSSARFFRFGLAGVLLLGLLPRLYGPSDRSLWFDEAFCWRIIQFPFFEMLERVGRDNHPPLYFILLKLWAAVFGDSACALRLLSVLFGVATIWGTYLFAAATFGGALDLGPKLLFGNVPPVKSVSRGQAIGLFSAALVALSAFQIRYSWEMRMYALAGALAVFSSWALVRALDAAGNGRRWLLYGSLALLLAYTHYYGLFTLAAQGIFAALLLWHRAGWNLVTLFRRRQLWYAIVTAMIVALAWLPWLPTFIHQRAQVKDDFPIHPVTVWGVGELTYQMFLRPEYLPAPPRQELLWTLDVWLVSLYLLARRAGWCDGLVLCLGLGPLAFCLLASVWEAPILSLRYFVPAHIFLLVGLAALVWRIRFRVERTIIAGALLCIFVAVDFDFWQTMDLENRPGARGAAAFLAQHRTADEPVIASMPFFYFSLLHDARDESGYYLFTDGRQMPHHYGTAAMKATDLIDAEGLRSIRARRVWVVELDGGFLGYRGVAIPAGWIAKHQWVFPDVFDLGNAVVVEYDTGSG